MQEPKPMLIPKNVLEIVRSASKDQTRYQLCGVHLERKSKDTIEACATDGKQQGIKQDDPA
jgi:DNA polymerase III sliding clamp (beta) subunit (PCNA family)